MSRSRVMGSIEWSSCFKQKRAMSDDGSMTFEVPFDLRADRSGVIQPWGEAVQRQPDGRRFVYLVWQRTKGGVRSMPGRIKVFFDQLKGFPNGESFEVQVLGRDQKGRPACATARIANP